MGQRRRAVLAAALVGTPRHALLDEPLEAMDRGAREDLLAWTDRLVAAGAAVVVVSHEIEPFAPRATRALAVRDGRCLDAGPLPDDPAARLALLDRMARGEEGEHGSPLQLRMNTAGRRLSGRPAVVRGAVRAIPPRDQETSHEHPHPTTRSSSPPPRCARSSEAALDRIVAHIESLPTQPISDTRGGFALAPSLAEALPEEGAPVSELLDLFFERAIPPTFNTASPGYLAYIPGGGLFQSAVADLIADSTNRYTSVYAAAPALAQIEANVIAWFCQIVGYPSAARGTLTSGGSLANWTALVTARRERLPENFLSGVIYASDQSHYSVAKGAILAGFPEANVREVPTDDRFRLRVDALAERIAEDRRRGLTPFLIAATAGTTNTGAVDPLAEIADLAARRGALAPRRRRLRRLLPADRGGETRDARDRAGGLDRARSAQGALPPLRHRRRPGARRRGAAPRPQPDGGLHAGDAERSRPGGLQPVLPRALAAVPRPARLAAVQDARRRRLPRPAGGEAGPRPPGGGPAARDGRESRSSPSRSSRCSPSGWPRRACPKRAERAQPALPRPRQRPPAGLPDPDAPARTVRPAHLRPVLPHPPRADGDGPGGHRGGAEEVLGA